jgi:hypothetical protein
MNASEREQMLERRVIHPATYLIRHDNGECFEVEALTIARARKLIEAECADRGWDILDTDYCEVIK